MRVDHWQTRRFIGRKGNKTEPKMGNEYNGSPYNHRQNRTFKFSVKNSLADALNHWDALIAKKILNYMLKSENKP